MDEKLAQISQPNPMAFWPFTVNPPFAMRGLNFEWSI